MDIKTILSGTYHLFLFKTYTNYPRWVEISMGIFAWLNLLIIIDIFINII